VALVRQGEVAAFETLYDRYHLRILSFCRHMLGSQPDGEDATQHAFVALHRHLTTDERSVDVKPWLFQVARNRCLSILRGRREHADADDPAFQPATEGLADSVQRRADLRALLADLQQLPEEQRAALVLSSLGDLSGDEIADVIGCQPQKVKALVFQARTALMNEREARDTDCGAIREQLATLRGGSLLRGSLRRHVRGCDGCRAFRDQSRHQREAMALLLPVIPTAGLKAATMSAAVGGAATAIGGGAAVGGGGGAIAALTTAGGKAIAAKVLVAAAIAGTGVGVGVAEVNHLRKPSKPAAPAVRHHAAPAAVQGSPAATSTPIATDPGSSAKALGKGHGKTSKGSGRPTTSPAVSPNAATGKGISGTQPGHGSGTTGKAGAPGQIKKQGTAKSHGKANSRKVKPKARPVHTKPAPKPKPKLTPTPATPTVPPGQAKQKPHVQTPAVVETVPGTTG
jgi:RNA polymerase sigma factor (sigma-70 family)